VKERSVGRCGGSHLAMKPIYCVFNKTTESFLGLNISHAGTPLRRLRGLLGKLKISSGEGVWLVPSQGIHTFGMLFPIDVIYLDANYRVIHLVEYLRPFCISPIRLKSASLLELPPHTIYASHTKVGDRLLICQPQEMETYLEHAKPDAESPIVRKAATGQ
jgi:uncharacterized membrane protein (UPF0127 family)